MADGAKRHAKTAAKVGVRGAEKLAKSADGLMAAAVGEVPQPGGGKARSGGEAPRRRRDDQDRDTEPDYTDLEREDEWELGR